MQPQRDKRGIHSRPLHSQIQSCSSYIRKERAKIAWWQTESHKRDYILRLRALPCQAAKIQKYNYYWLLWIIHLQEFLYSGRIDFTARGRIFPLDIRNDCVKNKAWTKNQKLFIWSADSFTARPLGQKLNSSHSVLPRFKGEMYPKSKWIHQAWKNTGLSAQ